METLPMITQAFGEESMNCTRMFEWHANSPRPKKARQVKSKVKKMLIIFISNNSP
jgi:hypothetical protein